MVTPYGPAISRARSVLAVGSVSSIGLIVALQIATGLSADAATTPADPSTTVPVLWDSGSFSPAVVALPAGDTVVVDNEDTSAITLVRTETPVFSVTIQPSASASLPFTSDVAAGTYKVQLQEKDLPAGDAPTLSVTVPDASPAPTESPSPTTDPSATPSPSSSDAPSNGTGNSTSDSPSADPSTSATGSPTASPSASPTSPVPAATTSDPAGVAPTSPAAGSTAIAPSGSAASEALAAATAAASGIDSAAASPSDSASPSVLAGGGAPYVYPHLAQLDGELAAEAPVVAVAPPLVAGAPVTLPVIAPTSPAPSHTYRTIQPKLVAANQVVSGRRLGLPAGLALVLLSGLSVTIVRVASSRRVD